MAIYTYDAVGNLLSITRSTGGLGAPQITDVAPTTVSAGTTVSLLLNGNNLFGSALKTDNPGIAVSNVQVTSTSISATLTIVFSARTGTTTLTVTHAGGSASTTINIGAAAPVISQLNPASGPISRLVTVTGNGFSSTPGLNTVRFGNGTQATVYSASPTRLVIAVPPGAVSGNVTVTVGGLTSAGMFFSVTPAGPAPTIASIIPAVGSIEGGGQVTITGSGFTTDTKLYIGGNQALNLTIPDDSTLKAFTPPGALGAADVQVTNANGDALLQGGFTYLSGPPEKILAVNPTMGVTTIPQNTTVAVLFSRQVDRATITASAFSLIQNSTNTAVAGSFQYGLGDAQVFFKPTSLLPAGTTFTLTLTQGIKSVEGIPLEAPFIGAFTTTIGSDTISPTISVSPANGATNVPFNSAIVFTFSEPINPTTLTSARLTVTNRGEARAGTLRLSQGNTVATFTPASPFFPNTPVGVVLSGQVADAAGNRLVGSSGVGSDFVSSFNTATTADRVPPQLLGITPPNGATGINTNAAITLTFNESLDPASIMATTLSVSSGGVNRPGRFLLTNFNSVITFIPDQPYPAFSQVTLTLAPGLTDVSGNSILATTTSTFTTQSSQDNFQPSVISVSPAGADVALNSKVTIVFSERINPITVNANTFAVHTNRFIGTLPGTITVAPDQRSATFTPASPLLPNETYFITYKTGINDLAGNPLFNPEPSSGSSFTFSSKTFRTGVRLTDSQGLAVVEISPSNGANGVPINAQLLLRFSEPVAPPTLTPQTVVVAAGGVPVDTEVSLEQNNTVARIKVANLLTWDPNRFYDVTVTTGVQDMAGNSLSAPFIAGFTTGAGTDSAPPTATTNPANGATVSPAVAIALTFNEPINPMTTGNIFISGGGLSSSIQGQVTVSPDRKTVTLQPPGPLPAGQVFSVSVSGVEDLSGNRVTPFSSNFMTSLAPGTDPNILPITATVIVNPGRLFADGQSLATVVLNNISDNSGKLVANGTKLAVTVLPAFVPSSAGGTVLEGAPSSADGRFKIVTTFGGRATFTYQSSSHSELLPGQNANAVIQVASVDSAEHPVRMIGQGAAILFRHSGAIISANPQALLADGMSYAQVDITVTAFDGRPVPEGQRIGITTDPVFVSTSIPGTLSGGIPAVDARFKIFTTNREGRITLTYTAPVLVASESGQTWIQAVAVDDLGNVVTHLGSLNLFLSGTSGDVAPRPKIKSISPLQGAMEVGTNAVVVIGFSESLDPTTVTSSRVRLLGPGSVSVPGTLSVGDGSAGANSVVTLTPTAQLSPNTTYTIFIESTIRSSSGRQLLSSSTTTFSTGASPDTLPPTVLLINPPDGATDVGTNAVVGVKFSEAINAATLHSGTVLLSSGGSPIPASLTVTSETETGRTLLTLTPEQFLLPDMLYMLTLTVSITDPAGNGFAAPVVTTFTTKSGVDTVQPSVLMVTPSGTDVPLNAKITLVFSEPINPMTVSAQTFFLNGVPGMITMAPDLLSATLTPGHPLAPNTTYFFNFSSGISDLSGNPLFNSTGPLPPFNQFNPRSFRTSSEFSDTNGPTVLEIAPVNGATGVPINAQVSIRFSEPLSPVSVTPQNITVTTGGVPVQTEVTLDPQNSALVRLKVANLLTWMASTTYEITVTTGVRDVADNPVPNAVISQFTTGTETDTIRPTVVSVNPPQNGTLARTGSISITFSEPIAPPNFFSSVLNVTGGGVNGAIQGVITFSADRTILTFTPNAPLFVGAFYNLNLGNIQDLSQNLVTGFSNSSFRVDLAPGTDPTTLPNSAVVLTSGALLGDGQSTIRLTITGISRSGVLVPDGTKVAVTADPAYRVDSTGGAILGGVTGIDPRFQIFSVFGGQVSVIYRSANLSALAGSITRRFAYIQVAAVDAADAPASLIGTGSVELFRGTQVTDSRINPTNLLANGSSYSILSMKLLDANGNPFPPGVRIGATADPVYLSTPGGTLSGGVPAPDPRFRLYTTSRGGIIEIVYTAPTLVAGQTDTGRVQLVEVDDQGNVVAALTTFSIGLSGTSGFTSPQPVVIATSPAHGQSQVAINSPVAVSFSESLDPATVTAGSFSLVGPNSVAVPGSRMVGAGPAGPNSIVTFVPDVPLQANASFTIVVNSLIKSASGTPLLPSQATSFSTGAATDNTSPTIVSFSPPSGFADVPTNAVVTIAFSEIMNATTLNSATLTLTAGGSIPARVAVIHDFSRMRSTVTLTPDQFLTTNTTFTASLSGASDSAGNPLPSLFTFSFTTGGESDTIAPSVLVVSPASGTTGVPLNAKASVVFSEPIDPTSINEGSLELRWDFGRFPATITLAPDFLSATLVPDQPLLANTRYNFFYRNKITDIAGNPLVNPSNTPFTTGSVADDSSVPFIVTVTPADGAINVPTNAVIMMQFSELLSAATVNGSTVTVSTGGSPVPGIVTLEQGRWVRFRPLIGGGLQAGATYTISVLPAVTDVAGNPLAGAVQSSFTVGNQADTTAPTVVSISPADKATNVPTTASIVVAFSEPINPFSVNLSSGAVRVVGGGMSGPVPVNVSFSPDNTTLTLTPTYTFFAGQTLFPQLSGIEDRAGNGIANAISTFFRTGFAAGTDLNTVPTSAIVVANPNILLADGVTTTTVTITGISRNGILVPDGTRVAITAEPAYFDSAGGTILGGLTSAADPRFKIFTAMGGQITVTYQSASLPNITSSTQALARIQVASSDASDTPGTAIGAANITLFRGTRVISQLVNPTTLLANGTSYAVAEITLQDNNGNPFPPGVLIGATADPIYAPSAGGTLSGGVPAPDPRFRLYATTRGGFVEVTYTAPSLAAGQTATGYIQFVEVDGQGNPVRLLGSSSIALSGTSGFTSPQPVVTTISPANGQTQVAINTPIVVAFSQSIDPATVTSNSLVVSRPNSTQLSGTRTVTDGPAGPNSIVTFTPDVPLTPNTSFYTVVVNTSIKSVSGTPLLSSQFASFSMGSGNDTTPPTITAVNPADGSTSVPTNVLIAVQFSERMNPATLHTGTLSLSSSGGPVSGKVQVSTNQQNNATIATFVPDQFLPGNESYTLTAAGMTDTAGNVLSGPYSLTFSTQAAADTTHPLAAGFSPPSGSIDVPSTIAVSVTFNEPVNPVSINPSTLLISGPTTVKSVYSFSNGNTTVTLTPTAPLVADGQYSISATRNIQDVAGNNLFTNASSSFRVALSPGTANLPTGATVTINPQQFFSNGQIATTVTVSGINRNGTPVPNGTIIAVTVDPVFNGFGDSIGGVISGSSLGTSTDPGFLLFSTFGASVTFSYTPPDVTYLPPNRSEAGHVQVASVDLDNNPVAMIASKSAVLSGIRNTLTVSTPTTLVANGTSTSTVTVTVKDLLGDLVPDGTRVGLTVENIFIQNSAGGAILGGTTSPADPRVQIFTTSAGQITATYQSPPARGSGFAIIQVVTVDAAGNPTGLAGSVQVTLQ